MKYTAYLAGFLSLLISIGFITSKATAAPMGITSLAGTWTCTSHGSRGQRATAYTFTTISPNTVQYSWVGKSRPDRKGAGVWYYDTQAHEYVAMGAGAGGWGVSRGSAGANDATVKLQDTYPPDPSNGTTTYHFSSNGLSFESRWSDKGRAMLQSGTCKRT